MRFKIFSTFEIFFTLPGFVIAAAEVVLLAAEGDILAGVGAWATGRLELLGLLLGLAPVLLLGYLPGKILQNTELGLPSVLSGCHSVRAGQFCCSNNVM